MSKQRYFSLQTISGFSVIALFLFLLSCSSASRTTENHKIPKDYIKHSVYILASEEMGGRLAGTEGERKARDFILQEIKDIGLLPYNGRDYLHSFNFRSNPHHTDSPEKTGYSVIGKLPAMPGSPDLAPVMIGAHYDHLGKPSSADEAHHSLAQSAEEKLLTHYGADDNASGVSAVLFMARHLKNSIRKGDFHPERDIYFAFWSAEESGLIGSTRFTKDNYFLSLREKHGRAFHAYLNLDMIGRFREAVYLQGTGSSPLWKQIIPEAVSRIRLESSSVHYDENPLIPSDTTPFYLEKIPVLNAFTGLHKEYHTPQDTPDTINFKGIRLISSLFLEIIRELASSENEMDFVQSKNQEQHQASSIKLYLGTIPDYTGATTEGLELAGVTPGSPAEEAGLERGDIVFELGEVSVRNIYDYTKAINSLSAESSAVIKIKRDGSVHHLEIIPKKR